MKKIMEAPPREEEPKPPFCYVPPYKKLDQISIEESLIQDEMADFQKQALRDALDLLPERQKEVLFLKYYNRMSYDEIEEILAINDQSIRNHIYRALQKHRILIMDKEDSAGTLILMIPLLLLL